MTSLPEAVRAQTEYLWRIIAERNTDIAGHVRQIDALRDERDAALLRCHALEQEVLRLRGNPPVPVPVARSRRGIPLRALRPGDGIPR